MLFQAPSQIEQVSTRADGTIKIVVGTQELKPNEMTSMFNLKGKTGWMLFSENEIREADIPEEPAKEFDTDKSPSQRLRAALYVYWDTNTNKVKTFDTFYKEWMNKKIEEIKDYLPERQ